MSDILVAMAELLTRVFHDRPDPRRFSILGDDYERCAARRSTIWVLAVLVVLFLSGWWVWGQLTR
jgi:hypothetical protein